MSEELSFRRGGHEIYATLYGQFSRGVLLCPPHPNYGGSREDSRLVAIASELADFKISALCFDYPVYTGGLEEVKDTISGLEFMGKTMTSLGLLGYSYGAVVASNASIQFPGLKGLVLISPLVEIDNLKTDLNSSFQKLIIYGSQDHFVTGGIDKLYNSAQGEKEKLCLDTDHFFAGFEEVLAANVRDFFLKVFQKPS
jgi:uncharacterized protein